MCAIEHPEMRMEVDMNYFDEKSWELLDAKLVVAAEEDVNRQEAEMDDEGKFVKVKWVRVN